MSLTIKQTTKVLRTTYELFVDSYTSGKWMKTWVNQLPDDAKLIEWHDDGISVMLTFEREEVDPTESDEGGRHVN